MYVCLCVISRYNCGYDAKECTWKYIDININICILFLYYTYVTINYSSVTTTLFLGDHLRNQNYYISCFSYHRPLLSTRITKVCDLFSVQKNFSFLISNTYIHYGYSTKDEWYEHYSCLLDKVKILLVKHLFYTLIGLFTHYVPLSR